MNNMLFSFLLFTAMASNIDAQPIDSVINVREVQRIEQVLASDSMQGRGIFDPAIGRAAAFIAEEFGRSGLRPFNDSSFLQEFGQDTSRSAPGAIPGTVNELTMRNVVGIIPGNKKKDEYVIFSAHYDHLGIMQANAEGDSIYNGANDNASGTAAVIMLSKYFSILKNNERTLVFVAFTGEEFGGWGSRHFSRQMNPGSIVAMFNIEMIGTDSKWGLRSAYMTGYDRSDMGEILGKNLEGSSFKFYPDPYPEQNLFFRSDNATLARLGVPAHTISTSKMDSEKYYHTPDDEVETLDLVNMTEIIKAIALSSASIIRGGDTPSRVNIDLIDKN